MKSPACPVSLSMDPLLLPLPLTGASCGHLKEERLDICMHSCAYYGGISRTDCSHDAESRGGRKASTFFCVRRNLTTLLIDMHALGSVPYAWHVMHSMRPPEMAI